MLRLIVKVMKKFIFFIGFITLSLLFFIFIIRPNEGIFYKTKGNVAHLKIFGQIYSNESIEDTFISNDTVISESIIKKLDEIEKDSKIKAILIEINSPGGTPIASQEIAKKIADFKKPSISWVRDIGTSGAYWVASASDYIVAHPLSITGSIGVLANSFGFEDFLKKFDIKYRRQIAGTFKDIGSPFREESEEEKNYIQSVLNEIHEYFIKSFSAYRNIPYEDAKKIANGLFYTGQSAFNHKLIDELGSKSEVISWLTKTINEPVIFIDYYDKPSLMKSIFKSYQDNSISLFEKKMNRLIKSKSKLLFTV